MFFYLGLICLIAGVWLLLINFNIIGKKSNAEDEKPVQARKIDNLLIRIASAGLCIAGLYLIWPKHESNVSQSKPGSSANPFAGKQDIRVWSNDLKEILTKQCLENGKRTAELYPEIVNEYCKCATEKISQAMTPDEYTQWMDKSKEEQTNTIRPIVQSCVEIMMKLIEVTQENQPNKSELKKNNIKSH